MNASGLVLNGIVMCAITSRTRQPAQSEGAAHCSGERPPRRATSRSRSALVSLISSVLESAGMGVPSGGCALAYTCLYDADHRN